MRNFYFATSLLIFLTAVVLSSDSLFRSGSQATQTAASEMVFQQNTEQIKQGEHLVLIMGCHDCHTPKKMTAEGPVLDKSRALSGHPSNMPDPDIDRKEIEQKGLAVTQTLTSWVGPWGISYASNLTPHPSGIGNWTEKNFITAIRHGKHRGVEGARMLLPPMPWEMYANMTDKETRAIFAYLKSLKPINNVVPAAKPPVLASESK
ncbi:cytochrome c [uncultured Pontibacter sp.]|uniref:c-type cytochrome n=1 Tax=uncultured Pontibacter sp. TaxID=453356 RepID=UPI0026049D98|nr:cytochrome c [uncultured Pontibacter sp.]